MFTEVDEGFSSVVPCSVSEVTGAGLSCLANPDLRIEVSHDDVVVGLVTGVESVDILVHHDDFFVSVA